MLLVRRRWPAAALLVVLGAARPAPASEGAFTLEAPAAAPFGDPLRPWSHPGALPAAAVYLSAGSRLLGGLRLRSGVFPAGNGTEDHPLGFVSLALAGRLRPF